MERYTYIKKKRGTDSGRSYCFSAPYGRPYVILSSNGWLLYAVTGGSTLF